MTDTSINTQTASNTASGNPGGNARDSAESRALIRARLVDVLPHPANPRADVGDLSDLIPSIVDGGVRQPSTALPADRVIAAWRTAATTAKTTEAANEAEAYADAIEASGAPYVLVMGHRRRAALHLVAAGATTETYPDAMPSDAAMDTAADTKITIMLDTGDLADNAAQQHEVMLDENLGRKDLSILDEAKAFAVQKAIGRSERAIAERFGRSQSHVNKRLSLLKLPAELQAAAAAGELRLTDANDLAKVDDPEVTTRAWEVMRENAGTWLAGTRQAIERAEREVQSARQAAISRRRAEEEGTPVIDPEDQKWSYRETWDRKLNDDDAIAAARAAGELAVGINTNGDVQYYTTGDLGPKDTSIEDYAAAQRADARERRKAADARKEHAIRLVATPPVMDEAACGDLVATVLDNTNHDQAAIAHAWMTSLGKGPQHERGDLWQWRRDIQTTDWATRVWIAHAYSLARLESETRSPHRQHWGTTEIGWLDRLIATGYQPTTWEQARLATSREAQTDTE